MNENFVNRIRVLLVDDHPVVRSGILGLLETAADILVVGEAQDGKSALSLVDDTPADVLLLDMELPDFPGTEVAARVKKSHPQLKVLSLSAYNDPVYVQQVLELGAAGYLLKDEAPQAIVEAIRGIAQGKEGWISRGVASKITGWMQEGKDHHTTLTPREKQTLHLIVQGNTNQAIALALGISEKTVEKHVRAIFEKLHVSSRVEAAVVAIKQGVLNE